MAFDHKTVSTNDWGVIGSAALIFIFSLFSAYVTVDFEGDEAFGDLSGGVSAWNSYASLGILLLLAVGALAAARVFGGIALPDLPVGWNLIAAGAAGLGALLVILRAFTYPDGFGVDVGPGWSGWVVMILAVAETVFAVLAFRSSGEDVPWQQQRSGGAPSTAATPPASAPPASAPPASAPPASAPPASAPPSTPPSTPPSSPPPASTPPPASPPPPPA